MVDGCVSSKFTSTEMNFLLVNLLDTFSFEEKQAKIYAGSDTSKEKRCKCR